MNLCWCEKAPHSANVKQLIQTYLWLMHQNDTVPEQLAISFVKTYLRICFKWNCTAAELKLIPVYKVVENIRNGDPSLPTCSFTAIIKIYSRSLGGVTEVLIIKCVGETSLFYFFVLIHLLFLFCFFTCLFVRF